MTHLAARPCRLRIVPPKPLGKELQEAEAGHLLLRYLRHVAPTCRAGTVESAHLLVTAFAQSPSGLNGPGSQPGLPCEGAGENVGTAVPRMHLAKVQSRVSEVASPTVARVSKPPRVLHSKPARVIHGVSARSAL